MKTYEILFLIRPDMGKEELNSQYKDIENIISKHSGKIDSVQDLGKRQLAYEIKKHKEGVYYLMNVSMEPSCLKEFESELKLSEPILRFAITRLDATKAAPAKATI
ncbi:MAG: 30S ribosomal protein S6 [Candidatus Omnitrophica bacterium]|nr:30S ribosomal protein S6 [Candidatus Omnitrophota bacterium]